MGASAPRLFGIGDKQAGFGFGKHLHHFCRGRSVGKQRIDLADMPQLDHRRNAEFGMVGDQIDLPGILDDRL